MRYGIPDAYIEPMFTIHIKDLYIFIEGPDDDSNGIETCRPSPINNILTLWRQNYFFKF